VGRGRRVGTASSWEGVEESFPKRGILEDLVVVGKFDLVEESGSLERKERRAEVMPTARCLSSGYECKH
jgi:hypothetical protein